ncbi:MAG: outer membrane lipoprotein-sorting protein [Spirochaetaceae bacterium]|jgi:outer membrane lipoprotein-sorting protein|nr:outer membrane lipoprotein-sorting protein [Spirochaetaceae bacterium]
MKKYITALAAGIILCGVCYSQDAASIIDSSRNRLTYTTISTRSQMVISSKSGSTSERLIDQYSKDGPNGNRVVIVFQSPASVAGTRFLTMANKTGPDDSWIYLPALDKVRRIASQEGSSSFMGTDLSYDDISSVDRKADKDTHTLLREESLNNAPCYVIQSIPKDSSYQYSKMISWIDKTTKVCGKMELYDKKGSLVKTFEILQLKDVDGRLSPWVSKMTTISAGTSTTINVNILKYDAPVPESVFTTNYLQTGKAN